MTEMFPGHQPGNDPRASAKAAKAYAKASRPWYKKKRFMIPLVLVVLMAIGSMSGGGDEDPVASENDTSSSAPKTTDTKKASSDKKSPAEKAASEEKAPEDKGDLGTEDNPAPVGKAVANKSARYVVNSVEVRDSLGEYASPPGGKYVVVTLTVENVKDETIQVAQDDFVLQVSGTEIEASDEAWMMDNAFSYDDLSPGLKRQGIIVYDVRPADAGKGVLKAQAMLSMDEALYLSLAK